MHVSIIASRGWMLLSINARKDDKEKQKMVEINNLFCQNSINANIAAHIM